MDHGLLVRIVPENHQVRMNVITSPGQDEWKNVEITGYVKVVSAVSGNARFA